MIIVDTREPDSTFSRITHADIRGLQKIPSDEQFMERELPCGDILVSLVNTLPVNVAEYMTWITTNHLPSRPIEDVLADPVGSAVKTIAQGGALIERKTPSDFLSSLGDGRLFDQVMRMVEASRYPIVCITGQFYEDGGMVFIDKETTKWHWWSVQMALLRIQMAGASVLFLKEKHLPELLVYLWRWLLEGNKPVWKPPQRQFLQPSEQKKFKEAFPGKSIEEIQQMLDFLCGIPWVGPEKSQDVLLYTGSVIDALHFLTNPESCRLANRPSGFGAQTIKRTRKFFNLNDGEVLLPVEAPVGTDKDGNGQSVV